MGPVDSCLRYIAAAGASAAALPLIQTIGIAATNAITVVFTLAGFALICLTIKYGKVWRERVGNSESEESEKI